MRNYINYFTEIEERFQKRRGSLLLLSTLDWVLIDTWREAGLPLDVVLRGIDAAFDKHDLRQQQAATRGKRLRHVNGLAWCAEAVLASAEQAAQLSLARPGPSEAGAPPPQPESGFEPDRVASFLRRCAEALTAAPVPPATAPVLSETAIRLHALAAERIPPPGTPTQDTPPPSAQGHPAPASLEDLDRTLSTLEERLVAALLTATPEPQLTAFRAEADRQLASVRSRLGAIQIRQLQQQFLHKRLLDTYRLPRLSLFYMSHA